jgi:hypothetical protein
MEKKFTEKLVAALIQLGLGIWYIIKLPYSLWVKAMGNLVAAKESGKMDLNKMTSEWPFISFLKVFFLEFLFDAISFASYFIGIICAIVVMAKGGGFAGFLSTLFATYMIPASMMFIRDLFKISILPFRKYLSWAAKPAQELDLNIKKEN